MTVLVLVGFAAGLAVAAHRLIAGRAWVSRAPRLGLLAWLASASAAVVGAAAAGVASVAHWSTARAWLDAVWRLCLEALLGAHGRAGQSVAIAAALLVAAGLARLAGAWRRVVAGAARERRAHRAMLWLADPAAGDRDLTVLAHPEPVAYVVPGRPPRIVISTAALETLTDAELAAVLAHEHAHAAGRHHWLLGLAWLLRRAFPGVPLFTHATRETARLVEMRADDVATRRHARLDLARALVAMATARPAAADGLRATGGHGVERLRRLLDPPRPLPAPVRLLVALGFGTLPLLPVLILALGQAGALFTASAG